jgi:hypothetical protein
LADLLKFSHRLLTIAIVLFEQLAVALGRFLFELLTAERKLLLHLGRAGLVLLLSLGNLLAGLQHQLLALLAGLIPQLTHLPRYVTVAERGAGFAEVAAAVLAARQP